MNSQLSTLNSQLSLDLHIEELVLDGFAPGDRYAIGDALERELERLFGDRVPISLRSENATDEIRGRSFNVAQNTKRSAIGQQIAEAVYQGFGQ
jgi:hypothetical protein